MKRTNTLLMISLFTSAAFAQLPQRTVNFSPAISGATNYTKIEEALSGTSPKTIIWVAAGTYLENELIIPSGVTLIGGFPANASTATDRVYPGVATANQQTILDGNYTHRVATVRGTLDGCIITKGYAYDATTNKSKPSTGNGGGVFIDGGIVQNCFINNNIAANLPPLLPNIPGTYVASIGDIYCTDGTILKPIYTIDADGKYVATLSASAFNDHIVMGIIFYIDPAPTSRRFSVLGKPSIEKNWSGNGIFNIPLLPDIILPADAKADYNGALNTDRIFTEINKQIPIWNNNHNSWKTDSWNSSALKYIQDYDTPTGTIKQWYLPAGREMTKIWEANSQVDGCARLLGWSSTSIFQNKIYWTSTEYGETMVWALDYYSTNNTDPVTLYLKRKTDPGIAFPVSIINYLKK